MSQDREAKGIKHNDPLVGQFVEILTIKAKAVNVWAVKVKATPEGMKAFEFELDAFPEHIRMFKNAGMKIQDGLPYDCGGYPHMGKIGLHGTSRRIVQMISDYGGFLSLEDSEKQHEQELEKARSIPALALVEAPKQENVGSTYILPTGDSLPELLAQLDEIADKLFDIWQEEKTANTRTSAIYGSNKMKRMTLGRIVQDIDALIRIAEIKDLRRKKAD